MDSEASRIRKIRAQMAETLEDVVAIVVATYWRLCFKRGVRDV
jgi:hypothetical protein